MKTPVLESLLNKVKNRLQDRCFPMNCAKFLRTPFHRTPPDAFWEYLGPIFTKSFIIDI